jgi:two-component system cell cycle sensor histidine kinase/response regulator CckA
MTIVPGQQCHIKADSGYVGQVLMNLVVNARDAMPNGGKLTFETADVSFEQESMDRDQELIPGNYVMLAITDTGAGMTEKVKERLLEPFFTTKAVGQGTGLGLSTCHGIVKQSGGQISVYSELGRGTTFKIYLPQVEQQAKISILLVEDDSALLKLAVILLRRLGYSP